MKIQVRSCDGCPFIYRYAIHAHFGCRDERQCRHPEVTEVHYAEGGKDLPERQYDDEPPPDWCPLRKSDQPITLHVLMEHRETISEFRNAIAERDRKREVQRVEKLEREEYERLKRKFGDG